MIDFTGNFRVEISLNSAKADTADLLQQLLIGRLVVARLTAELDSLAVALASRGRQAEPSTALDASAVAGMLGVSVSWVRRATRAGRLPSRQVGRRIVYDAEAVRRWLERRRR